MRLRPAAVAMASILAVGLLAGPGVTAPAGAAGSRCAAHGEVVRETSAGGRLAGRTPLLVASYNTAGYNSSARTQAPWEARADRLVGMILRCSPDVIGLQEASEAWMQRRAFGQRNYSQYEHVVDLMNARTAGAPYRVTNAYREFCPTTGRNPAVWNGTYKGAQAPWRTCTTAPGRSSSDNRTIYDSRVMTVVSRGSARLSRATSNVRTVDWTVFRLNANGKLFAFANTHFDAKYRGKPITSSASNAFRRKQAAQAMAVVRKVRAYGGRTLPVVVTGDLNSSGRTMARTGADVMTKGGLVDLLGTDRRVYRSKSTKWRGSCRSVGSTSSLGAVGNPRVPLHVTRRITAYYNTSNAMAGKKAGTAVNRCMFKDKRFKRPRGASAKSYYRHQGVRIDYILTSGFLGRGWETVVDANLRRAKYRVTPPSDHNMVAATLAF
ncbi:endonuclease/exonuclease/phosphatase family protein [Aeromicrobium duanguangcaii]|uniref:Endonuclease/exonuclease/phosphatase family protein n=1 Tax=Aeromicrobium duanguangcaii TaxID=2968086 RepID=A0ABY5KFT6_9ACTN|nr:endonuclease/exonuclease/phosphatase family protein [Aeromicrobium duanguangcaii]MCD9154720.1 endonuclease/exonuclease/phosphatase family protein [Aeromicrobium duanguangcaii]UUI67866.1 endonuclease/exonuclease/phosphatase family protein [Aeromicrobium duanguangcaii]